MRCCEAFDVAHGHAEGELSLEKSHDLMRVWSGCHTALDGLSSAQELRDALADFKESFFRTMQQGFKDKCISIRKQLVSTIESLLVSTPPETSSEKWGQFKADIENFQRLGTADMFSGEEQDKMKAFATAAETFHACVFNSCLAFILSRFV